MRKFAASFVAAVMIITLGACISGQSGTDDANDTSYVQTV